MADGLNGSASDDEQNLRMPILPWAPSGARPPAPGSLGFERYHRLYLAVGQSVMMWSLLEGAVDLTAQMMFHGFNGVELARKRWPPDPPDSDPFPQAFSRQIALISAVAAEHADLTPWRSEFEQVCKGARKKNDFRTWLIHARLINHEEFQKTGLVTLRKTNPERTKKYAIDEIAGFVISVQALANEFGRMVTAIATEMSAKTGSHSPASTSDR